MMKKVIAALLFASTAIVAGAGVASADQPGPGDKQCVPGQHGNPHPGFKAGVC